MADLAGDYQTKRAHIDPLKVELDDNLNGRYGSVSDEKIRAMALSLIHNGQKQPIIIRRLGIGQATRYAVVAGFTRTKAARLINTDPELRALAESKSRMKPGEVFALRFELNTLNDKEALWHNVVENLHRNDLSPIDKALCQRRLRDAGYSDDEIAELYDCKVTWLDKLETLLLLSDEHRRLVHTGELCLNAAFELLGVMPEQRDKVLSETGGKPSEMKKAKRASGQKVGRSRSEVFKFLKTAKEAEYQNPRTQVILASMHDLMSGEIDEEAFLQCLEA